MAEAESKRLGKGSAADLLSDWRAAERDAVAAKETADVATLAAAAAEEAVVAARETGESAKLSSQAAQRAETSALRTAQAAEVTARAARHERKSAETELEQSTEAESEAADRFHEAQKKGFPKP